MPNEPKLTIIGDAPDELQDIPTGLKILGDAPTGLEEVAPNIDKAPDQDGGFERFRNEAFEEAEKQVDIVKRRVEVADQEQDIESKIRASQTLQTIRGQLKSKKALSDIEESRQLEQGAITGPSRRLEQTVGDEKSLINDIFDKGIQGLVKFADAIDRVDLGPQKRQALAKALGVEITAEESRLGGKEAGDIILEKLVRDNPEFLQKTIKVPDDVPLVGGSDFPLGPILAATLGVSADLAEIIISPSTLLTFGGSSAATKIGGKQAALQTTKASKKAVVKAQLNNARKIASKTDSKKQVEALTRQLDDITNIEKQIGKIDGELGKKLAPEDAIKLLDEKQILERELQHTINIPLKVDQIALSKKGEKLFLKTAKTRGRERAEKIVERLAKNDETLIEQGGIKWGVWGRGKLGIHVPEFQLVKGATIRNKLQSLDLGLDHTLNRVTLGKLGRPAVRQVDDLPTGETIDEVSQRLVSRVPDDERVALVSQGTDLIQGETAAEFTGSVADELSGKALAQSAPQRSALHTKILAEAAPKTPLKQKNIEVFTGSAGGGKSKLRGSVYDQDTVDSVRKSDPDEFKEWLPEYKLEKRKAKTEGRHIDPAPVHEESSLLAARYLGEGLEQGDAIFYETVGHNKEKILEILDAAKKKDYETTGSFIDQTEKQMLEAAARRQAKGDRLPPIEIAKQKRIQATENVKDLWVAFDNYRLIQKNTDGQLEVLAVKSKSEGIRYVKGKEKEIDRLLGKGWREGAKPYQSRSEAVAKLRRSDRSNHGIGPKVARDSRESAQQLESGPVGRTAHSVAATMRRIFKRDLATDPNYKVIKQRVLHDQVTDDKERLVNFLSKEATDYTRKEARILTYAFENTPIRRLPKELRREAAALVKGDVVSFDSLPVRMQGLYRKIEELNAYWGAVEQKEGILKELLENYVHHAYKDSPSKVVDKIITWKQTSDVPGFAKQRTIPSLAEAREMGLEPVDDIFELTLKRGAAHSHSLRSKQFTDILRNHYEKSGVIIPSDAATSTSRQISMFDRIDDVAEKADDFVRIESILPEFDLATGLPKVSGAEVISYMTEGGRKRYMPFREVPKQKVQFLRGQKGHFEGSVSPKSVEQIRSTMIDDLKSKIPLEDIRADLERIQQSFVGDPHIKKLLRVYDTALNTYKGWLTSPFPAFHVRNATSNVIQNSFNVGFDAINPKRNLEATGVLFNVLADELEAKGGIQAKLAKQLRETFGGGMKARTGEVFSYAELAALGKSTGVSTTDLLRADFTRDSARDLSEKLSKFKALRTINPASKDFLPILVGRKAGQQIENQARLVSFVSHMRQGRSPAQAAELTKKFLFDYGNLSPVEKQVFRRVFPFYTWTRKNIELQAELFLRHPQAYRALFSVFNRAKDRVDLPEEERDAVIGDIAKLGFVFPLGKEGEEVTLVSGLGIPPETAIQFLGGFREGAKEGVQMLGRQMIGQSLPASIALQSTLGFDPFFMTPVGVFRRVPAAFKNLPDPVKKALDIHPERRPDGTIQWVADPEFTSVIRNLPPARLLSTLIKIERMNEEDQIFAAQIMTGLRITKANVAKSMFRELRRDLRRKQSIISPEKKQIMRERLFGPLNQPEQ